MLAIIPARGGSKGLPGKNIKPLHGKPLIAYTIEAALASPSISRVVVSTECEKIAEVSRRYGSEVPFLRPMELAQDNSLAIDAYIYTIEKLKSESQRGDYANFVVLQPTSPLRTSADIENSIAVFKKRNADAVIACREAPHPVQWHKIIDDNSVLRHYSANSEKLKNRQEEPITYLPNGSVYVLNYGALVSQRTYYTDRTFAYVMPAARSVDIDTIDDFEFAEYQLKRLALRTNEQNI
jgi:N-acylneuraminate cytidylyltransferase/CMP-N,N'-diacetyllegionaminic acid synthase